LHNLAGPWIDYTINGLIVGNIYALLAVGLSLIFGVANLINFAHGSVFSIGAYIGWICMVRLHLPFLLAVPVVLVLSALLGVAIERLGIRPLQGKSRIATLLTTIGIGTVLDQLVQLVFTPDPRALPSDLPNWRIPLGGGTIGPLDLLIAGVGILSAVSLFSFLRFTKMGWAVRATAQDVDAARQMGVDTNRVNMAVFAIASALGGIGGLLVGMYYNDIDPYMSLDATLKGIVAMTLGGVGNMPGAILGGLLLGLTESYGIAVFGSSYRNLFAFGIFILVLVFRPHGLFHRVRGLPPESMTGTFISPSRVLPISAPLVVGLVFAAVALPLTHAPYLIQVGTNALLYALVALSLTLVAGTAGMVSLGQAALLAIGAYASALLATRLGWAVTLTIPLGGAAAALLGTLMIFPAFRMRGHYVSVSTLAIGEIVSLVILNWTSLTGGAMGLSGIAPLEFFGIPLTSAASVYWLALGAVVAIALIQIGLLKSHLGRSWRAIRDDEVAARSYGLNPIRYKALAFGFGGFAAGLSGAITAHLFSYIDHETFNIQLSMLALTIVILGGLGSVYGAILGSVLLIGLPELLRFLVDYRVLFYGVVLLLLIRFRPQGLLGTA
jgi:branched-chain amino acid transport system permease protein